MTEAGKRLIKAAEEAADIAAGHKKLEDVKWKPLLCLDFDGVIHDYKSWTGIDSIPQEPVPGAMEFIAEAISHFKVSIFSSRSCGPHGLAAMQSWLSYHMMKSLGADKADSIMSRLLWPTEKPPAMVTIDDRAITFTGRWPSMEDLLTFQPWNKVSPETKTKTDVFTSIFETIDPYDMNFECKFCEASASKPHKPHCDYALAKIMLEKGL